MIRGHGWSGRLRRAFRKRPVLVVGALLLIATPTAAALRMQSSPSAVRLGAGPARAIQGGTPAVSKPRAVKAVRSELRKPVVLTRPTQLRLRKAHSAVFDVRRLKSTVVKRERPERLAPGEVANEAAAEAASAPSAVMPSSVKPSTIVSAAPAPAPSSSFEGLDYASWGAGHPPDTNGDVGPTYYMQTINTSIGIYDKSNGNRVAAFTFNAFMSQGSFGNICDTNNFGDPVVLYDSFENRWFVTDFAFQLDGSGNVTAPVLQCFAVSKTSDPVAGGWNFYSIESPGALDDYPKFSVWPDGIYMSANMFGYSSGYIAPHVWAIDKQQMYDGAPSVQVADFQAPNSDFTLLPANARLQAGTPPAGTPDYFVSTWDYLNALTVYKFHVDWDKISTSTFTGPELQVASSCWPNANVPNAPTTANSADTLQLRAMAQAQYSNVGGAESVWVSHTVRRGESATSSTCNAPTSGAAAVRWYQANVTGGTVAANTVQSKTWDPDGSDTFYRYMPSLAVDRMGDMAVGYSKSNATTNPQIKYAGRLAGDPANTFSQTEQTLIDGTGSQSGNCGSSACTRWGDYSGMSLDPNGCTFWQTSEYYVTSGLDHHTRIGAFTFPGCTTVGNGTLSGTVTDGTSPVSGATVSLGTRTTTTNGSGGYSFSVPAGTYPSMAASKAGFDSSTPSSVTVPSGATATRNFTLSAAATSGCFVDNTQTSFQRGVPANCDLTTSPGSVVLANPTSADQQNSTVSPTGFGFNSTSWAGQTFTPSVTGQLAKVSVELFCSSCSGTNPDITVSLRNTTGTPAVPTGPDLATATLAGFNDGAAGGLKTVVFATPATVTAGTRYAFVFRSVSTRATGVYAFTCSCATTGYFNSNPYLSGQFVTSGSSGSSWSADTTVGGRDLNFVTFINSGYASSGSLVSSLKDANPSAGHTPSWTTLSFTATKPAGTDVKFQVAGSNSSDGPFAYVGPDGTAATFFTTSGASLSQFNGLRYLRYKAFLSTASGTVTPALTSVSVCFNNSGSTTATSLAADPASGSFGGTTTLSATLTAGGPGLVGKSVSFTLNGSSVGSATTGGTGVATLSGVSLAGINAGSYPTGVAASFAGDSTYAASGGSAALTVSKASQTIGVTTHAPAAAGYNQSFGVAATSSSGLSVAFSSSGSCSNVGSTFTMTSATGTCTVAYDQAGNGNYNAAPQVTESVTAQKAGQTIAVTTHAPANAVYNSSFAVAATGGASGNPVTFSSGGSCSNVGATFTMTSGTGTCSVKYDQAGSSNYNAAPQVTESVTAQKASQAITVTTHAPANGVYNTSFDVAATGGGSGNPVTFSSAGACSNVGHTFTFTSGTGTCTVKYDQAGNTNYNAAAQTTETASAQRANQTITGASAPANAVYNTTFDATATAGASGVPVSFSSAGVCTNVGKTFTMTSGTGTCTVKFDEAGDANYNAAPQKTLPVTATKAGQTIAVGTHAPGSAGYHSSFDVAATSNSGLVVSFSSAGSCSNVGHTFTITTGTGACTVKYDQGGDGNYNAATQVTESVTATKGSQTIAFGPVAGKTYGAADFAVGATSSSGLAVSFAAAGSCTGAGATIHITSAGSCVVTASQPGDTNYNAASNVSQTVPIAKAVLTATPSPATFTRQYSDPNPAFAAALSGFVNGDTASVVTTMPACSSAATSSSGPGSYAIACAGGAAANYSFSSANGTLTVVQEDARTSYNGSSQFVTPSSSSSIAHVTLSAAIRDISAVAGDPAFDSFAGDIRNATVTFVNRATNAPFAGCSGLPVTLTVPADATTGSATCTTSLAATQKKGQTPYTVGVVVSGFYARDASAENHVIDVSRHVAKKTPPRRVTLCFRHRTVKVTSAQAKSLRKRGAKVGACKKRR